MKTIINYISEVRSELTKVVWPKKAEVTRLTLIVVFFSVIIGAYVGLLDYAFTKLLELLIA